MISPEIAFDGFGGESWANLLSLFGYRPLAQVRKRPTLVIVEDADGAAIAGFRTDSGAVPIADYRGRDGLPQLCEEHGCRNAVVLREGALETLAERTAADLPLEGDYLTQLLAVLSAFRKAEDEGSIHHWPARKSVPSPSAAMVERTLDLLLPEGRSAVLAVWENGQLWTALALRRRAGQIDAVVGPRTIEQWTGPLSGDHRRDHRAVRQAVAHALSPVHLGVYALRRDIERLLRTSEPGAWLQAVAVREVILNPAPTYAGVALSADAARAIAHHTRDFLGGLDLFAHVEPLLSQARDRLGHATSVTRLLGFNPLERLADRLHRSDRE